MRAKYAQSLALAAVVTVAAVACKAFTKIPNAPNAVDQWALYGDCDTVTQFTQTVEPILQSRCATFHVSQSPFIISDDDPNKDYAYSLAELLDDDGGNPTVDPILVKATGGDSHSGGQIFNEIAPEYATIAEWILAERLTPCTVPPPNIGQ
ncbi:MAG TPA: hypothetical protein VL588_06790 [Bdellovibrionota bacterium]|nr:hypothetical protein [Bdellovibrionota bacterium]